MRTTAVPMNPFAPETQILRGRGLAAGSGAVAGLCVGRVEAAPRTFGLAGFGGVVAAFGFAVAGFEAAGLGVAGFGVAGFGVAGFGVAVAGFSVAAAGFEASGFDGGAFGVAAVGAFARRLGGRGSVMPWAPGASADQ